MISPSFATMLCFVQTDAALAPETADLLLGVCVKRSFDRITVDGQLSTNDTVILMASGESGVTVAPESEDEGRFGEALDWLLRKLALLMVRDGEGAERVGRVVVHGGHEPTVVAVARAVANSPLVKAALNGGDPNWGRIAAAVGTALHDAAPLALDIWIEDVQVCANGAAVPHKPPRLGEEVEFTVGLPGTGAEAEVYFSDLSHGYVTINAEYTT
jgi:glutamate N-acetyltransferase/amino-acid N-acetyltransferase